LNSRLPAAPPTNYPTCSGLSILKWQKLPSVKTAAHQQPTPSVTKAVRSRTAEAVESRQLLHREAHISWMVGNGVGGTKKARISQKQALPPLVASDQMATSSSIHAHPSPRQISMGFYQPPSLLFPFFSPHYTRSVRQEDGSLASSSGCSVSPPSPELIFALNTTLRSTVAGCCIGEFFTVGLQIL